MRSPARKICRDRKACSLCKKIRPSWMFKPSSKSIDRLASVCDSCHGYRLMAKDEGKRLCPRCLTAKPPEEYTSRGPYCRTCHRDNTSKYWKSLPPEERKRRSVSYQRKAFYGLDAAAFDAMLASQGGLCKLCREKPKRTNVDHDHRTGKVRGILCQRCNVGLGLLGDSIAGIEAALAYLKGSDQ